MKAIAMPKGRKFTVWDRESKNKTSPYCACLIKKSLLGVPEICSCCFKRLPKIGGLR